MAERASPVLYLTGGVRGVACLGALLEAGASVAGVLGVPGSETSEAAELARRAGIPYRASRGPNHPETLAWIEALACPLAIMSGYNRILRRPFLERFGEGVINLHGGPLPEYRGGSPLNWQILHGEPEIGISILWTEEGIDTGPVLAADRFPLGPDETIDRVVERTLPRFQRMLLAVLEGVRRGTLEAAIQDERRARYFAKRLPEDGWIDWRTLPERRVHDLVRALSGSYPGAFTFHRGEKVGIESTRRLPEILVAPPGRVLARREDGVEVACADRALLVTRVRRADGAVVAAREGLPPRNATFDALPPPEICSG